MAERTPKNRALSYRLPAEDYDESGAKFKPKDNSRYCWYAGCIVGTDAVRYDQSTVAGCISLLLELQARTFVR
jgi:hypothetical protein